VGDPVTPRRGVFGDADERPYRRLVGDWIRLALAGVLVAVSAANPPIWGNFATKKLIGDGYL
jgi:hypothetical protein